MEVIYGGLRQTPETIAAVAVQEDVDVVGLSMHNGAHLILAPAVIKALRAVRTDVSVVVGGIVPVRDIPILEAAGVAAVIGPGASAEEVIATIEAAASGREDFGAGRATQ
jgi:methylmalonyl-CoA mutase C-terminal domain/subunit